MRSKSATAAPCANPPRTWPSTISGFSRRPGVVHGHVVEHAHLSGARVDLDDRDVHHEAVRRRRRDVIVLVGRLRSGAA